MDVDTTVSRRQSIYETLIFNLQPGLNDMNIRASTLKIHRQRGAVLIASMLILLVLTVVGISGLNNSNMGERMSSNIQNSFITFQRAEASIGRGLSDLENSDDILIAALTASEDDTVSDPVWTYSLDAYDTNQITGALTVSYVGIRPAPNSSVGLVNHRMVFSATSSEAAGAIAQIAQGAEKGPFPN